MRGHETEAGLFTPEERPGLVETALDAPVRNIADFYGGGAPASLPQRPVSSGLESGIPVPLEKKNLIDGMVLPQTLADPAIAPVPVPAGIQAPAVAPVPAVMPDFAVAPQAGTTSADLAATPPVPLRPSEAVKAVKRGFVGVGEQLGQAVTYAGAEIERREKGDLARKAYKITGAPTSQGIEGEKATSLGGILRGVGETTSEFYSDIRKKHPEWEMSKELADKPWHDFRKLGVTVLEAAPLSVAGVGLSTLTAIATKNPYLAATVGGVMFGGVSAGQTYKEGKAALVAAGVPEGEAEEDALAAARLAGAGEAALEFIPGMMFMRLLNIGKPLKKEVMKEGFTELRRLGQLARGASKMTLAEGLEEGAQQLKDNAIARGYYDSDRDFWEGVPESFAVGSVMGLGMGGGAAVFNAAQTRTLKEEIAKIPGEYITATDKQAALSELGRWEVAPVLPHAPVAPPEVPTAALPPIEAAPAVEAPTAPPVEAPVTPTTEAPVFETEVDISRKKLESEFEKYGVPQDSPLYKSIMEEHRKIAREEDTVTGYQPATYHTPTLERTFAEHKETGAPFTYGTIDLKNLGGLNKHFGGESAANPSVRAMTDIIKNTIEESGVDNAQFFRQGGDEFSIVAPGVDRATLDNALKRAKVKVDEYAKEQGLSEIYHPKLRRNTGVGIYYGVAEYASAETLEDVIGDAETLVYEQKGAEEDGSRTDISEAPGVEPGGLQPPEPGRTEEVTRGREKGVTEERVGAEVQTPIDLPDTELTQVEDKKIPTEPKAVVPDTDVSKDIGLSASELAEAEKQGELDIEEELQEKVSKELAKSDLLTDERGMVGRDISKKPAKAEPFEFKDKEVEVRFTQAKQGAPKESLRSKIGEAWETFKRRATRTFEHLPRTAEFAQLQFNLIKSFKQSNISSDKAVRDIQGLTIGFDKSQYDLFTRKVILDDLASVDELGKDLPFGFTSENLADEVARLDSEVAKHPEVLAAVKERTRLWDKLKGNYAKTMADVGYNVEEQLGHRNYYRHQVIAMANLKTSLGTGKKLKTPTDRSFLRERKGSTLDISTNYIEAEHEVMSQMLQDIETAKIIQNIEDGPLNIAPDVKVTAKKEGVKNWIDAIPEGYVPWQPREGHAFYIANSIPASLATQLHENASKKLGITEADLRQVMARGSEFKQLVVKEAVAETLDNLTKAQPQSSIAQASKKLLRVWKVWTLISPRRFFKYNARNVTGDADALFVGNPRAFLKAPRAAKDLYDTMFRDKPMTSELKDWFDRGGFESTLQAQEMGQISKLKIFSKLHEAEGKLKKVPLKLWLGYWKAARISTDFREAILRYAAYLDYVESMEKSPDGKPKNFGASMPKEIMGLKDIKDRAFWLSNDLLGAYDRISVLGQELRDHLIPFWSFKEVNFRRYVQLWRNIANDKSIAETVGRKALSGAVLKTPVLAYKSGKFLILASALWAMLQAWNLLFFPDEEAELPPDQKHRPHIILGRNDDGTIRVFHRLGAFGDFLGWFGLDAPAHIVNDWFAGRRTAKEIAIDMAKSPVNVVVQGVTPFVKLPAELLTKKSLFPDVFKPVTVRDRGYHVAKSFGVENEYRELAGLPSKGYSESLYNLLYYKTDPLQTAYYAVYEEKNRLLKKLGKEREGSMTSPRGSALYNFKLAVRYKDKKAAKKYLEEYVNLTALSGTSGAKALNAVTTSLQNMHPLKGLTEKEKQVFLASLDEEGKENLRKAIQFFNEVLLASKPAKKE
ncbi:MAG: diguanylate cyclase [Deltaproteobacteria bacterium]|nr:diguanylate cyclase [Deltaproteobacteria bacterium]